MDHFECCDMAQARDRARAADLDAATGEALDQAVTMEFILLYHRLAQRYLRQFLGHGPSPLHNPLRGQGQVIAALKKRDGISTKELAAMLDIRTASLNELLVKLEAKGLIERSRSASDGRVIVVRLTEAGRAVEQAPIDELSLFYEELSDDDKRQLVRALDSISSAVKRAEESDGQTEGDPCAKGSEKLKRLRQNILRKLIEAQRADVAGGRGE